MGFNPNLIRTIDFQMCASDIAVLRKNLNNYIDVISDYPSGKFDGRGIVYTAGGVTHVTCLWVSINILRDTGCTLPIEVWHLGEELSLDVKERFDGLDVSFMNFNDYASIDSPGYYLKPLAIINSRFEEVLFLDSDNVCLRNPEYLFDIIGYKNTGTIFWADYWITDPSNPIWEIVDSTDFSIREQESGQILINKKMCWRELNVCVYFNNLGRYYYKLLYGDKDTFKFSWIALKSDYYMIPKGPATCGDNLQGVFLGNTIVQFDHQDMLIFLHRNLLKWDITLESERKWKQIKCFVENPERQEVNLVNVNGKYAIDFNGDYEIYDVSNDIVELEIKSLSYLESWRKSKVYFKFFEHMHLVNNRFRYINSLSI